MATGSWVRTGLLTGLFMGVLPGLAAAQRNGDVSNGMNNQPSSGEVQSRERAAGVAPPAQAQQAQTGQVDTIYKQLMTKERQDGQTTAPASPTAPMGQGSSVSPLR